MQPFVISGKAKEVWKWLDLKTELEAKRIIVGACEKMTARNKELAAKTAEALEAVGDLSSLHSLLKKCPYDSNISYCSMARCQGSTCPMTGENERKAFEYLARRNHKIKVED
jgi:hypothetical protein